MMPTDKKISLTLALICAGAVGLVGFALLKFAGGFGFAPAFFLALLIAIAVFGFLQMAYGEASDDASASDSGHRIAAAKPAASSPAPASRPAASAAPAPEPKAPPAAAAPAKAAPAAAAPAKAPPAAAKADMTEDFDKDGTLEGENEGSKPATLSAPRAGGADNLKEIKGVGPAMEKLLHSLGFYHFDQVASWSADEVAWVNANLGGFKGRVSRDDWVAQAKILATGGDTSFSKKVDKGGVY